eukprot:m51a1_g5409 hypothetical protein (201) ;mRNA; f:79083-79830
MGSRCVKRTPRRREAENATQRGAVPGTTAEEPENTESSSNVPQPSEFSRFEAAQAPPPPPPPLPAGRPESAERRPQALTRVVAVPFAPAELSARPRAVRVVALSDTHGRVPQVPECDLLLHAGDFTVHGTRKEVAAFAEELSRVPARRKLVVCGNHDPRAGPGLAKKLAPACELMYEEGRVYEFEGLRIYGASWGSDYAA